jgi:hypothetical protein
MHRSRNRSAADQAFPGADGTKSGFGDRSRYLLLHLFDHGAEQRGLVFEVVVERAAGDAGARDDLFGRRVRETLRGDSPRALEQGPARRLGLLGFGHPFDLHQSVCWIQAARVLTEREVGDYGRRRHVRAGVWVDRQ